MRFLTLPQCLLAALCLLSGWSQAWANTSAPLKEQATVISSTGSGAQLGSQLTQLLLGLLLVIGLMFLLAWLARRLQQQLPGQKDGGAIRLLATRPLGPRERLLLVQVGKEQILLGLTPGSIETLHVLQEPVAIELAEQQAAGAFARRLRQALHQSGNDDKESQ